MKRNAAAHFQVLCLRKHRNRKQQDPSEKCDNSFQISLLREIHHKPRRSQTAEQQGKLTLAKSALLHPLGCKDARDAGKIVCDADVCPSRLSRRD
jgi:hypothetical protein